MKNILMVTCIICLSASVMQAQDTKVKTDKKQKQDELHIKVKEAQNPDIYIDGKKYDYTILELLDQSKIESVNVLKGESAIKEYNAPNGVIILKTKKGNESIDFSDGIKLKTEKDDNEKPPMVIIDGKVSNKEALEKLSPEGIEKIDVVKGEKAIKDYNAPNGVIIIKTKTRKGKN